MIYPICFSKTSVYLNKCEGLKSDVFNFLVICFNFCSLSKVAEYFVVFNEVSDKWGINNFRWLGAFQTYIRGKNTCSLEVLIDFSVIFCFCTFQLMAQVIVPWADMFPDRKLPWRCGHLTKCRNLCCCTCICLWVALKFWNIENVRYHSRWMTLKIPALHQDLRSLFQKFFFVCYAVKEELTW